MYLLIPQGLLFVTSVVLFTFHNVSINSLTGDEAYILSKQFTFHNVSINSGRITEEQYNELNLHSIMYLLIRGRLHRARYLKS